MAAPFCPNEQEQIRTALINAAMHHASTSGMKRTSVDLLTTEVGISKGAFYHFYASKEMLFLSMLEHWYQSIARYAANVYAEHAALPPSERACQMFMTAIRQMMGRPLLRFIRDEVPLLCRRLPKEILSMHHTSVDDFVLTLIHQAQIPLLIDEPTAVAILKTLMTSILYAEEIGTHYEKAMELTIRSICSQLIGS